MEVQREFGTPWEVVLAQMQKESSVGTAGVAVNGADNNWLGITGSGDAGSYISESGREWAVYSSVEASIRDWGGWRVLRNGIYDAAFSYLSPSNYDLHSFVTEMVRHYAPSSDGNNEEAYVSDVMSFINGPIAEVRAEMGWPSSAELAAQEGIDIGGAHALGSSGGGATSYTTSTNAGYCTETGNGDINATAILLSWDDDTHEPDDPKPEYYDALHEPNGVATLHEGDSCSIGGNSCDAFVATVLRHSGVDSSFPCCGAATILYYLEGHPEKYEEIPNTGSAADLQPGDIRASAEHVEIYVVLPDGTGRIASASHCDRTADHARSYYSNPSMKVFRAK